eukprot:gene6198-6834_t
MIRSKDDILSLTNPTASDQVSHRAIKRARFRQGTSREEILQNNAAQNGELSNIYTSSPNNLRIIAGTARGKRLRSPEVYLRPMMAKVREAIFSTLTSFGLFESHSARILDIFSGAGSVGLESLSRGAAHATFVDLSPVCVETCRGNAQSLGFADRITTIAARAEDVLAHPQTYFKGDLQPYQLVSLTPPYQEVSYTVLVQSLCSSPLLAEDSLVLIEYPVEMGSLPFTLGPSTVLPEIEEFKEQKEAASRKRWSNINPRDTERNQQAEMVDDGVLFGLRNRRYGRTVLALYVFRPSKQWDLRPTEFLKL